MLFDVNDTVRASVQFKDSNLVLTDPTTVTVTINGPGSLVNSYVYPDSHVVKDTTGTYHTDFQITVKGRWWVTWSGTGSLTASDVLNFLTNEGA